jgi:hypothetical protein
MSNPWRRGDEGGWHFFIEVPPQHHAHSTRYIAGFMRGWLRRKQNTKPAAPQSQRRPGESKLFYRLRTGQL